MFLKGVSITTINMLALSDGGEKASSARDEALKMVTVLGTVDSRSADDEALAESSSSSSENPHSVLFGTHVLCDFSSKCPETAADQLIEMSKLGELKHSPFSNSASVKLNSVDEQFGELQIAQAAGVNLVVDSTHTDSGRDPAGLARLSKRLGMCLVMGATSNSAAVAHLQEANKGTKMQIDGAEGEQELIKLIAGEIERELLFGWKNEEGLVVRAGIIGEVCASTETQEQRLQLCASAVAQNATGAPLIVALPLPLPEPLWVPAASQQQSALCHWCHSILDLLVRVVMQH